MTINKFVEGIGWLVLGVLAFIAGIGLVGCEDSRGPGTYITPGADAALEDLASVETIDSGLVVVETDAGRQGLNPDAGIIVISVATCVGDAGVPVCSNPDEVAVCSGMGAIGNASCSGGALRPCIFEGMEVVCVAREDAGV